MIRSLVLVGLLGLRRAILAGRMPDVPDYRWLTLASPGPSISTK